MQKSITQFSIVECSTAQYSTVQNNTAQYSTAQHSITQSNMTQHSIVQYSITQHSTGQYSITQHSTVQYTTVQYGTSLTFISRNDKASSIFSDPFAVDFVSHIIHCRARGVTLVEEMKIRNEKNGRVK